MHTDFSQKNLKEREHLEDMVVGGKMMLRNRVWGSGLIHLAQGRLP